MALKNPVYILILEKHSNRLSYHTKGEMFIILAPQ